MGCVFRQPLRASFAIDIFRLIHSVLRPPTSRYDAPSPPPRHEEGAGGWIRSGGTHTTTSTARRRELRNRPTDAEHYLWYALRGAQLDGRKFRRQHGIGPYIVDFFCAEEKLIIELDGDIHDVPEVKEHDRAREEYLTSLGFRILRFENAQALGDPTMMLEKIRSMWKGRER